MNTQFMIIHSRALCGINAPLVSIESHFSYGTPTFSIVGLPETAVKESRDRVRSAILNSQFEFPVGKIVVNLAPADLPKEGSRFDLAIALSIIAQSSSLITEQCNQYEFLGELGLSGEIRPVHGILPAAIACRDAGKILILPFENAEEASHVSGLTIIPAKHLLDVFAHITQQKNLSTYIQNHKKQKVSYMHDMKNIKGQSLAKRGLEIAAAGNHNVLMIGPPGTGKSLLAQTLPSILPEMTEQEALETATLYSVSHKQSNYHWAQRPFRSPHHSTSSTALVGGGSIPKPGEISLAHNGVLFLDELPEFGRQTLDMLREPLENHIIHIARAAQTVTFPASFQLIAAMNPCPCGYLGDEAHECRCSPLRIDQYRNKLSGPLLDRIDLIITVHRIPTHELWKNETSENMTSANLQAHINRVRKAQEQRQEKPNSKLKQNELENPSNLSPEIKILLEKAMNRFHLSMRACYRILRVARTIADLSNSDIVTKEHLLEAITFRSQANTLKGY